MILINYEKEIDKISIIADEYINNYKWIRLLRLFEDEGRDLEYPSYKKIILPWWSFLSLREKLKQILDEENIEVNLNEDAKNLLKKSRKNENNYSLDIDNKINYNIEDVLIKKGFSRKLTKEQLRNVSYTSKFISAATFSVPGAGKTTEALAYFFLHKSQDSKLLVVSPKNAFAVWESELKCCAPNVNIKVIRLIGGKENIERLLNENATVFLITYNQFSIVSNIIADFLRNNKCFVYLDESHRMKRGFTGVYGSSLLNIAHLPFRKLLLTGTPMPNSLADLIPQFTFLYPEVNVDENNIVEKINKIYVRTTKHELNLKEPKRYMLRYKMRPAQRRLYDCIRSEARRQLENLNMYEKSTLRQYSKCVVRLIQVTTNPALLAESAISEVQILRDAIDEGPGIKIEKACQIARKLASKGQKSIIWSQFVQIVEDVASQLQDLNALFIHGGVKTDEDEENTESRETKIRQFHQDPKIKVLVANPAACSESISLHHVCHNAIYIDRNYNAGHYLQSEYRIHRLGLKPNQETFFNILTCENSIDQSIDMRLNAKVNLMSAVLNDKSLKIEPIRIIDEDDDQGLTQEDVFDIKKIIFGD
jgi:SNF2 family DNA or RNA helicase